MTRVVNVHEAKTHLSRLLDDVRAGEEIILAKAGEPYARLVPMAPASRARRRRCRTSRTICRCRPPRRGNSPPDTVSVDHRDPFDRLLAAQAERRSFVLVTADRALDGFPITTLW